MTVVFNFLKRRSLSILSPENKSFSVAKTTEKILPKYEEEF